MRAFVRGLLGMLLFLLVAVGLLWLARERLTHTFLRPWLEERAAVQLDAEVRIAQIRFDWQEISLTGLRLVRPGSYEIRIEEVLLGISEIADLLRGRLSVVILRHPSVILHVAEGKGEARDVRQQIPPTPPVTIEAWQIEDGRLQLIWPQRQLQVEAISANGRLGRHLTFRVEGQVGREERVPFAVSGQGLWEKKLSLTLEELVWQEQALLSEPVTFHPADLQTGSGQISLDTLADDDLAGLFAIASTRLPWPEHVAWKVQEPSLGFRFEDQTLHLDLRTRTGELRVDDQTWPWQEGSVRITKVESGWTWEGSLEWAEGSRFETTGRWVDNRLAGDWRLRSPDPYRFAQAMPVAAPAELQRLVALDVGGGIAQNDRDIRFTDGKFSGRLAESADILADFAGVWQNGHLSLEITHARVVEKNRQTPLLTGSGNLALETAPLIFQGDFQTAGSSLNGVGGLLGVDLPAAIPQLEDFSLRGSFRAENDLWSVPVAFESRVVGQGVSGRTHVKLTLQQSLADGLRIEIGQWQVSDLEYANPQGTIVVAGVRLKAAGSIAAPPTEKALLFDLHGRLVAAEALVESWYGDLQGVPLNFQLPGRWQFSDRGFSFAGAEIDLGGMVTASLNGNLGGSRNVLEGQARVDHLAGDFQVAVQRLAADLLPDIKDLQLGGGLSVDFRLELLQEAAAVDLKFKPDGMALGWRDALRWQGLRGVLPVRLRLGDWPEQSPDDWTGFLEWQRLQGELLDSGPGALAVRAAPNRWWLAEPVTFAVAGGKVEMSSLRLGLDEMSPDLQTSLVVTDLELERITKALGWPDMAGQLQVDLEDVRLNTDLVRTEGRADVKVFGGDFQIRNMRIEAPLSRFPTYHADVEFRGVDLAKVTRTFSFGEINGVADGFVHDLRLFNGLPAAFKAKFATREEGERNISVKAIRNLNTLSQGGLSAALSSGIYQFIDFYRYRKIGFICSLRNDVFHLEGTARSDSDKYLINGGWLPPKIDVIISSPTISFKEMVKRLKRIERAEN